jgi:hypothetical protein
MNNTNKVPTSDIENFQNQLNNPNTPFANQFQEGGRVQKINKNLILSYVSDSTGCGHIRNIFPMTYLNSVFGKTGNFNVMLSPVMIFQEDILMRTRSIFFQRTMDPRQKGAVQHYRKLKEKFNFKMVYDIDDFIWKGPDTGEQIPDYNFGSESIGDDVRQSSIDIMNMMDTVCVSTEFLKYYLETHGVTQPIVVVDNSVSQYFWGPDRRAPIKNKIKIPRVIYTGSPTHYHNPKKLKGDWENNWCEWVIKNVKDNKIDFCCMGGLPFFFEEIKDKIKVIQWVNSYQYHLPIKEFKPQFGIAPLVPNYFNYSKSDIKHVEHCAMGALSIGTVFTNGKPSPYDKNFVTVPDTVTVEQLDRLFDEYTEPEIYNNIIQKQYQYVDQNGRWTESPNYVNSFAGLF